MTADDDRLVIIASLLREVTEARSGTARMRARRVAREIARDLLTPTERCEGPYFDEPGRASPVRSFRGVVERALRLGMVHVASHMLDSLVAMVDPATLEGGRLLSTRAALSGYGGYRELAFGQYRQVTALGRRIGERELVARGLHGMMFTTWSAGNLPGAVKLARRAIKEAADQCPRVRASATMTLAASSASLGDFDAALAHGWRSYKMASHSLLRETALANIAQILVDAGYPGTAQAASAHLLRNRRLVGLSSVIGTYALASAALRDTAAVDWAAQQAMEAAGLPAFQRETADGLLECSFALEQLGRVSRARELRARALALASRHGYHDIVYLAEQGVRRGAPAAPRVITNASQAIVTEIGALEPDHHGALAGVHAS